MTFKKIRAAGTLLTPSTLMGWIGLFMMGCAYLWLSYQPPAELQLQTACLGLAGFWIAIKTRPFWRIETLRLVPEFTASLCLCVLLLISVVFGVVGLIKLLSGQSLDMLLLHAVVVLVLVISARVNFHGFWMLQFVVLLNSHYLLEFLGHWSHLYWVQALFFAGGLGLAAVYYILGTQGWDQIDWYQHRRESEIGSWMGENERRSRITRLTLGCATLLCIITVWTYQSDAATTDVFVYYTGPLVVLGVPLIFIDSLKPKMVAWWVTARDDTRDALGSRAVLSVYANTILVAGFFVAVALMGLIAFGRVNWLIVSNLLLALAFAGPLVCVTVYYMNRLKNAGMYPLYIVCAFATTSLTLFWLGSFLPAGPTTTFVLAIVAGLIGAVSARVGGSALSRVELF